MVDAPQVTLLPLPHHCERVSIRRLRPSDLRAFHAYRSDSEVARYQGWSTISESEAVAFLHERSSASVLQSGHWCQLGIATRGDDQLIGDVGVCVADDLEQAEIGFSLGAPSQGKGFGNEAVRAVLDLLFMHTPVARVIAITDARNVPVIRLLERVGMRMTSTVDAVFKGQPCVEHVFAIRRGEG
jgi:ribosomal-protein-alanine N-acetyltransferase